MQLLELRVPHGMPVGKFFKIFPRSPPDRDSRIFLRF